VANNVSSNPGVWVSANQGVNWTQTLTTVNDYTGIKMSSDGQYMAVCASSGNIYTSSDFGNTWIVKGVASNFSSITMSSDSIYMYSCIAYSTQLNTNIFKSYQFSLSDAIAIGKESGYHLQGNLALAIGNSAGQINQSQKAVAIGSQAGQSYQGDSAVAIGSQAGQFNQNINAVAIGYQAGQYNNGSAGANAIAIGLQAGQASQQNGIAIGENAGQTGQGVDAVAIGNFAGIINQHNNSIIINASGSNLNSEDTLRCYIAPIRNAGGSSLNALQYDPGTSEITVSGKTFVINHPLDDTKYLVHACLEGPEVGVYYRGEGKITNNSSVTILLPDYVDKLATNFTVQLTPIYSGKKIEQLYSSRVQNNSFTVYGENTSFYWLVHGKRGDINVEPYKVHTEVKGTGPYRWI
jgi:hypothetical protein